MAHASIHHRTVSLRKRISRYLRARIKGQKAEVDLPSKMAARKDAWMQATERTPEIVAINALFHKIGARPYVERFGIALPALYHAASGIDDIDFAALPDRIVIKPVDGWSADGVMLIDGDREIMRGVDVPRASLAEFVRTTMAAARYTRQSPLMVEELLADYDPAFAIPRDFKVFAACGKAHVIQVIDRNGPSSRVCHSFYDRRWRRIADRFKTKLTESPEVARPPLLGELIAAAEQMSADLRTFMRIDFYLTTRGVVFGEFTPTPADGTNFTPYASRLIGGLMDRYPSPPRGWTMQGARRGFRPFRWFAR